VTGLVERKRRVELAIGRAAPIVKQKLAKASTLNSLQKLLGNDLVGIDIRPLERRDFAFVYAKRLHALPQSSPASVKTPVANISKVSGDRGGGGHHGTDQVGAPAATLATLEIPIAGGSAALARLQNVGIHAQAHRAAGLAPFKAGLLENLVQTFLFRRMLHGLRSWHDHGPHFGINVISPGNAGGGPQVLQP